MLKELIVARYDAMPRRPLRRRGSDFGSDAATTKSREADDAARLRAERLAALATRYGAGSDAKTGA